MNTKLLEKNNNNFKIKPLVRILKKWNVSNGKVYSSYELENHIVGKLYYFDTSIKDYFFSAVNGLPTYNLPEYKKKKSRETTRHYSGDQEASRSRIANFSRE